jgi:tetratricopeptide (TPR) repeat protein
MKVETGLRIKSEDFPHIFQAGMRTSEIRFLEELVQNWLLKYPNDIKVNIFQAEIFFSKGELENAKQIIQSVLERDPENLRCYDLLAEHSPVIDKFVFSALHALSGKTVRINDIFPWAIALRAAKNETKRKNFQNAEKLINRAISEDPNNILIALEHYRIVSKQEDITSNLQLNEIYHRRWQHCIPFKLWLALSKMNVGQENSAVSLLHTSALQDPGGIVASRLLGSSHEYLSIWPKNLEICYQQQVPTSIAVALDWNRLQPGTLNLNQTKEKQVFGNIKNLENVKINPSFEINNRNTKQRVYVIFSSKTKLNRKYGPKSTNVIIEKLDSLSKIINKKGNWESIVYLADEFSITTRFGLDSINEIDPWKLKLSLTDLSKKLSEKNKYIGAVLIVGNDDVVPFHHLPNPTDDSDKDVQSDNPYSTTTSNYLLPEWPVGRLPGERGKDPGLLLDQIRQITKFHSDLDSQSNIIKRLWNGCDFRRIIRDLIRRKPKDFGYSAEVWRRSSLAAFRPLGKGSELRISPPYDSETIDIENLIKAKCAYFNLHGLSNSPEWYGQRDFSEISTDPDFPVAINANKISKILNNIDLVFTEACYGGLVSEKTIDESIAMKLISIGSQGLVGSTSIAYGSVFTPLIGADLLGFIFWKYTKDGYSFGESLMYAKIGLVKVMNERQGYLDGEDQKTLLSFVLYGDPIGYLEPNIYLEKFQNEEKSEDEIHLVTDQNGISYSSSSINENVSKDLSELLQSYVPGLEKAHIKIRKQKVRIQKNIDFEKNPKIQINSNLKYKNLTQILYSKSVLSDRRHHTQYARVTMDDSGKIIKLAVSR